MHNYVLNNNDQFGVIDACKSAINGTSTGSKRSNSIIYMNKIMSGPEREREREEEGARV